MSHTPTPWTDAKYPPTIIYPVRTFGWWKRFYGNEDEVKEFAAQAVILNSKIAHDELVAALEQSKEYTAELERRLATALAGWTEFKNLLADLSHAVIEYGRTDMADTADAEWDAVLAADKIARAALAKEIA